MNLPRLTAVLILVATSAFAQPTLEGKKIVAVQVSGLDHILESVVLAQILSVPGSPYHQAIADRDVVRLDRLGVFGVIRVTGAAEGDGVRVDVTLTETPRMIPAIAVAVTDENGASAGPAVKLTSIAGHPI